MWQKPESEGRPERNILNVRKSEMFLRRGRKSGAKSKAASLTSPHALGFFSFLAREQS